MAARRSQEGMDASRSALAVSRLPRAAHEPTPTAPARLLGIGTSRHHQACRGSYTAAQLRHPSPGAQDRYSDHPGFIRSRDILPANTLLRSGFTTRSILVAARVCLFSGNTPTVMLSWSSFRSPTGRSPAYRRGCHQHVIPRDRVDGVLVGPMRRIVVIREINDLSWVS